MLCCRALEWWIIDRDLPTNLAASGSQQGMINRGRRSKKDKLINVLCTHFAGEYAKTTL
jgi:hypothetical protein